MEVINFELSKRLNDLGLLDEVETEFCFSSYKGENDFIIVEIFRANKDDYSFYKTLTLSEAIEFLPSNLSGINKYGLTVTSCLGFSKPGGSINPYYVQYAAIGYNTAGKTLLLAIEKMIEYLLDNNLLIKK